MKRLMMFVLACITLAAVCGVSYAEEKKQGGEGGGQTVSIGGKVVDVMNSGGYTYVQTDNGKDVIWIASPEMSPPPKKGDVMFFAPGMVMENFESKTLKRKFDKIVFTTGPVGLPKELKADHTAAKPAPKNVKVTKAEGANAQTVEGLFKNAASLNGKVVKVKGTVVKVSSGIMGKNWLHIQDGTGSNKAANHDLTVTTKGSAAVGDVVTITGKLAKDKDFGAGYKFAVIVEDAEVSK